MFYVFVFFFFQAEDGIRDHCVTGVQTCALPISAVFDCSLQPGETGTGFLNRAQVNPTAEACAEVPDADVAITKQVDQADVDFDSDATTPARLVYTLVITNNGPDPAVDAMLDD